MMRIGVLRCSYDTGTGSWVEVRCRNPLVFTSWRPRCASLLSLLLVYIFDMYLCMYMYLCMCVQIFDCDFSMYVFLSLVLGFIVQAGYSFHMYRNAPGLSYWKWFWFCFFVPLIVKTVMSISDFHRIFRICDGLHWLRLVLLVIPHPLESELK